ncbi:hypothetical protein E2C01_102136 [Portunus trituberculatus]|uniref:Uncharacterized protein n=1 Tax=Portunus trituberculatus TaxID=210409 RepID=A0A5B7KGK1_PORTR|nr:hypothetical protein [Portunus trituberculatus]
MQVLFTNKVFLAGGGADLMTIFTSLAPFRASQQKVADHSGRSVRLPRNVVGVSSYRAAIGREKGECKLL